MFSNPVLLFFQDDKDVIIDIYAYQKSQAQQFLINHEEIASHDQKQMGAELKHFRETYDENTGKYMNDFGAWRNGKDKKQPKITAPPPMKTVRIVAKIPQPAPGVEMITIDDDEEDLDSSVNLHLPSSSNATRPSRTISSLNAGKRPTASPAADTPPAKRARGRPPGSGRGGRSRGARGGGN